ncbi:hypothetical protein QF001_000295 [Paraburkholderia youngii]
MKDRQEKGEQAGGDGGGEGDTTCGITVELLLLRR